MRIAGLTTPQIAAELGVSRQTAWRLVRDGLAETVDTIHGHADTLRAEQAERLRSAIAALMPQVEQGHLGAIDRLVKVEGRLAQLLNLDLRPEKAEGGGPPVVITIGPGYTGTAEQAALQAPGTGPVTVIDTRRPWEIPDVIDGETVDDPGPEDEPERGRPGSRAAPPAETGSKPAGGPGSSAPGVYGLERGPKDGRPYGLPSPPPGQRPWGAL